MDQRRKRMLNRQAARPGQVRQAGTTSCPSLRPRAKPEHTTCHAKALDFSGVRRPYLARADANSATNQNICLGLQGLGCSVRRSGVPECGAPHCWRPNLQDGWPGRTAANTSTQAEARAIEVMPTLQRHAVHVGRNEVCMRQGSGSRRFMLRPEIGNPLSLSLAVLTTSRTGNPALSAKRPKRARSIGRKSYVSPGDNASRSPGERQLSHLFRDGFRLGLQPQHASDAAAAGVVVFAARVDAV
jgi:hypothetical protein